MTTARLLPWFGSNTANAARPGELLQGCRFVGVPFAGGMPEVPHIDAKQVLVNDLHWHVINLCWCLKDRVNRQWLESQLDAFPYHPGVLKMAQDAALKCAGSGEPRIGHREAALAYFIAVWMNRGGKAGTADEFSGNLPIRWNANGGGSNRRYRTAIAALDEWGKAFRRCEFVCMNAFDFLGKFKDEPDHGLYVDAPWPDAGDEYLHKFTEADHVRLESCLMVEHARVVVRFGEHPLIRQLYNEPHWDWLPITGRNQANTKTDEWLICRNLPV